MSTEAFDEILDTFEFLDEWEERYRYVIELGKEMPPLENEFRAPATKVHGCASQVWILPKVSGSGRNARFSFRGDSDAMIVRGLIAILASLYNGLTLAEVVRVDASTELAKLGLHEHLSSQRSNGLVAMVARIRALAAASMKEFSAVAS
ncbi:MAG: SufE family protein [Albidovulum sp.]|nr:SufE family protein [Albidovulum sp.]MDE0305245.1 SufE family protein [Albidovulum sp.]MDE0532393.1 SufE family protein [Albidovulum sp.]